MTLRPSFLLSAMLVAAAPPGGVQAQATGRFDLPAAVLPPPLPWSGASERLIADAADPWITPVEQAGFETTPRFADVRAWLDRLAAASPLITIETFGRTAQGRDMILVRASKAPDARGGARPVVLIQAGIHSGEIDGKDAGLMLLRDIALRGKDRLLDAVDLVFVPVYNIDGHEQMSRWNFPALRGPLEKGVVANARGINLNRDYAKADAPETRAMIALLRRLDPILYVDSHVSDGFDMQYDITFTYAGWGRYAYHRATADWLMTRFGPAAMGALERAGHMPTIYPSPVDTRNPTAGIRQAPEGPRYSTGYGDFIGVPTVLVENHMLKPYRQRVLGTYVLFEAALKIAATDADRIAAAKRFDRASRPATLLTRWKPAAKPIGWIERFKGVAFEEYRSPVSGRLEQRWTGRRVDWRMPIVGQDPVETIILPAAWWIPPEQTEVIERLRLHGIKYEIVVSPPTLTLDRVLVRNPNVTAARDGRIPLQAKLEHSRDVITPVAGSARVPLDQPLGLLAASLLEPESQDSLFSWGFFPELLIPSSRSEAFVRARLADAMLADEDRGRAFAKRIASDPAFAADAEARLSWIEKNGPVSATIAYPILRELR